MAIPPKKQTPPQRSSRQYTLGTGFMTPPTATVATQPLIGKAGRVPPYPYIFGADFNQAVQLGIGAMAAGATNTATEIVGFPDIPTLRLDPSYRASLKIIPQVYQNPITAGLVIASVQAAPQAYNPTTAQWIPADMLVGGTTYTAFRVNFTLSVVAVAAIAGANLNVGAAGFVLIFSN